MIAVSQPTSAAEVFANAAAVRKRLMSPQARPVKSEEPKGQVRVIYSRSIRQWRYQQDEHVKDWREHLKSCRETPEAFVRRRCVEMGVSYRDVVLSNSRFKEHAEPRQLLMAEVRCLYPRMSFPAIGKMFGMRDHTTAVHACRKHGIEAQGRHRVADHHDEIRTRLERGDSNQAIADALGFTHVAIWAYLRKQGWKR
jgi:hypothetical protein